MLRGSECGPCRRAGHYCPAALLAPRLEGEGDEPICLECADGELCVAVRCAGLVREESSACELGAMNVFGDIDMPGNGGKVVHRTPEELGIPRTVVSDQGSVVRRAEPSLRDVERARRELGKAPLRTIQGVQVRMPAGVGIVRDATPTAVSGATITLEFSQRANAVMMEKPNRREAIERVINRVLHAPEGAYKIKPVAAVSGGTQNTPPSASSALTERRGGPALASDDQPTPILDAVIKEFGGRIIEE